MAETHGIDQRLLLQARRDVLAALKSGCYAQALACLQRADLARSITADPMMAELASVLQHKLTLHEDSSHDDGGSDDASDSSSTPRSSDSEGSGSDADDDDAASSACDETRAADTSSPSDLLGAQLQGLHCTAPKQLPAQGGQAVPTQAGQHGSSAGGRTAAAATMAQGGACPAPTRIQLAPSSFSLSATQRRQLRQQLADALEAERDAAVQSALQDRDPLLAAM